MIPYPWLYPDGWPERTPHVEASERDQATYYAGTPDCVYKDFGATVVDAETITGKFQTTDTSDSLNVIYCDGAWSGNGFWVVIRSTGVLRFSIPAMSLNVDTVATYADGLWHSFSCAYASGTATVMVDGVSANGSAAHVNSTTQFPAIGNVGYSPSSTSTEFTGYISNLQVYRSGVVWAWFKDGNGKDHSGNGNNLTSTQGSPVTVFI